MMGLKTKKILRDLPSDCIIPNTMQPRKVFGQKELEELSESIKELGIIQPLIVRYYGEGLFELIAGERRLRAARLAGLATVPCVITETEKDSSALMALVENLQRKDLDCFEQANGISALLEDLKLTQNELSIKIGKSQPAIANKLRLLKIPFHLQEKILASSLTERHARAILKLSPENMDKAIDAAIKNDMNVADFEKYINSKFIDKKRVNTQHIKGFCRDLRIYINTINKTLNLMKNSGFKAKSEKEELPDKIIYKITITK